jgi:dienelactone hydrolase
MTARRKTVVVLVAIAAVTTAVAAPYVGTLAFLLDLSGAAPSVRRWMPARTFAVSFEDVSAPTRFGAIATRIYSPNRTDAPTIALFPGIHGGGVEEPRLASFCTKLATTGVRVVCTPLPDLRRFRVTGRSTDMIEDVTAWVASSPTLAPRGRVVLVGVSFAGGLAVVAAGRPAIRDRLQAVIAIGGHGSLARTLEFLCTGTLPDGSRRAPHDYGLAVVALAAVPRLVPPQQQAGLTRAIETFLEASLDASPGREIGMALLADAEAQGAALDEPARSIARAVTSRDVATLGRTLRSEIPVLTADPALSPESSPPPPAPVFLLHGRDDNVVPSTETPLLAANLEFRGHTPVRWLLSPLVSHAEIGGPIRVADFWALLRFWHEARRQLDD